MTRKTTLPVALIQERNQGDFRTGPDGDPANAMRYSQFAQSTRTAVANIVSGLNQQLS